MPVATPPVIVGGGAPPPNWTLASGNDGGNDNANRGGSTRELAPTPASAQIINDIGAQGVKISLPSPLTSRSATQIIVDMTQQEAIVNLQSQGFSISYGGGGAVTMLSKDGVTYTFYGASTGGGVAGAPSGIPSASVTVSGQATKIRFIKN
jgi:filamentous hemagglutinin